MSLLTMTQFVCRKVGVPQPSTVIGNTDPTIEEIRAYIEQSGQELVWEHDWQALQTEQLLTTLAALSQGAAYPAGGVRVVEGSMYNRTEKRRVYGPLDAEEWQAEIAYGDGTDDKFRIWNDLLYITPAPPAGQTVAYEYMSEYWIYDNSGAAVLASTTFTDDDADYARIDEHLIELDAIWRFKEGKGFVFEADKARFDARLSRLKAHDKSARRHNLSTKGVMRPRVPLSSWNIS